MSTKTFPSTGPPPPQELDPALFEDEGQDMDPSLFEDEPAPKKKSAKEATKEPEPDLLKLAKERRETKGKIGVNISASSASSAPGAVPVADASQIYKKRLSEIDKQIKDAGYDPDEVERDFYDLPSIEGFTGQQALKLKAENRNLYDRKLAAIKSQTALSKAVEKKAGPDAEKAFMQEYFQGQRAPDYEGQRKTTKAAVGAVHEFMDDEDKQRKTIADLVRDKAYGYGIGLPGQKEAIENDPRSANLNPYQVTALQFLEDVDPPTAQSYNRLLAFSPEELEAQKGNSAFMRGWESKARDLENIGMNIQRKALEEKMTGMLMNKANWNEAQKADYLKSLEAYETLSADQQGQDQRYPAMAVMDADRAMQEAMGESTKGVAEKTVLGIGENVDDAINWIGDLTRLPFMGNKDETGEDLELMGDKKLSQLSQYETEAQQLFSPETLYRFKGQLKKDIDKIRGDKSLTDEEQRDQIRAKVLADKRKNVDFIANDKGGKMNLTGKTFINTVSNIVSEIAPQLAIAYLTGGGANASKVQELASLFGSTFAIGYRDNYNSALEQNIAKPGEYAFNHTLIDAASELMHNDLAMAKKLFKGKAAALALGKITQQEMAAIGRAGKGRFAKFAEAAAQTAKGSVISAWKEGAEEYAGRLGSNAADKVLFNQDVPLGEGTVKDFVTTFVGMLPLGLLGLPANYNQVNRAQQYAIYEAGMDPAKYNAKIDEDLAAGTISEGEAAKRKKVVAHAAAAIQEMETTRADGSMLTDNQKAKYIFNQLALTDIEQQSKNATPELKSELEAQKELIENEQKEILKPEVKEQTVEEVEENRKKELANADVQYKDYLPEFQEEQKDVINEKFDEQLKEVEKREKEKLKEQEAKQAAKEKKQAEAIPKVVPGEQSKEEAKSQPAEIKTEEDVERELTKALQNVGTVPNTGDQAGSISIQPEGERTGLPETANAINEPAIGELGAVNPEVNTNNQQRQSGAVDAQEQTGQSVKEKGKDIGLPYKSIASPVRPVSKSDLGITSNDTMEDVVNKMMEKDAELKGLLQFIKGTKVFQKVKFENYEAGKDAILDDYLKQVGANSQNVEGLYFSNKKIENAHPLLKEMYGSLSNRLVLFDPQNAYYTATHELLHAVTLDNISEWKNLINANDKRLLEGIFKYLQRKAPQSGSSSLSNYGLQSMEEFLVESLINPHFRAFVEDIYAENREEFMRVSESGKKQDFIQALIDFFRNLLRYAFGKGVYAKDVAKKPLIEQAVDIGTKLFLDNRKELLNEVKLNRKKTDPNSPEALELAAFDEQLRSLASPMAARKPVVTQEDAVKDIIKRTPKNIDDARLLDIIKKATNLPDATIQQWIDDVRNLPPAIPPPNSTIGLTPSQRQLALNQFDKLFRRDYPKPESWIRKNWNTLKNISSQLDNPYRFVTKIVQDINKHYDLTNKEVIPLGRAFEKSAAGRATLRVDQFLQQVLFGRIGKENYGKLKGKKYDDFQKYLAARRIIDRIDIQERKRANREDVSRQTGNITKQAAEVFLENLSLTYKPEVLTEFAVRADAFQQHMDLMLQNLVANGNISQEAYKEIKADNDFYAPFSVVRSQMLANQKSAPMGIAGVVKRIKGIGYDLQSASATGPVAVLNDLAQGLQENKISPEEYFNSALQLLEDALNTGKINQAEFDSRIAQLENPGFELNHMLDAAATMIYRAEGMALKNNMLQRLYAYKEQDTEGLYIQDVDGFMPMTLPGGDMVMVPRPLNTIPVNEGFAPVRMRIKGKDKIVAINKYAADKLNGMSNFEMPAWMKWSDGINKLFRAAVITVSPGFQVVNFVIDFVRASMLSRYGALAGKGLVEPIANLLLYIPQYIEALAHSALGNVGIKTKTYKQWMESDSFSKGMFDNLFDNEKRIKSITSSSTKRILDGFLKLKFIEVPGSAFEQTHKLLVFQRGMAVEGFKPEMFTAMLGSLFNQHVNANMSQKQLSDAMDRLNYEVQNYAGSPNFPQTAKWLKVASLFLQFFSARVKGEMTDYRRVANMFRLGGEGVKLTAQDRGQLILQTASIVGAIAAYALTNNADDDDEADFNSVSSFYQDNYLNIPSGYFEYEDADGNVSTQRDYIKIPLRGLTASINVVSNKWVKWRKREDPASLKAMALGVAGNASPMNLHGKDEHEWGESAVSNLTPAFKYFMEYSFNRDTHSHRDIIPDQYGKNSMLSKYRLGDIKPWNVATDRTPNWARTLSEFIHEHLGISVSAITLDHMERTMGNPTELYDNAIEKRLLRSKARFPVAGSTPMSEKPIPWESQNEEEPDDENQ